ncbi:glutathione S-transferase family protein [Polymorphum gilvum]|uniref:Glutathione S-transferase family protein n=1 Tax=Polymorphum gilvum (strain LMG 25793 / CGMCC 1.9160 / SL003B-26A1) TaxID=991905 RepID=F2IY53_POLGS|nr:glutathione S-transferase [Polymorphum gilvum]ADZ71665.1 Glutathione S-transferase family protein [Polymorphum gilvum SL003B-26A1]
MAEYALHCFAQSGNAYKPALMLELSGADWEAKWVDFFNGASRSPEFRESLNEMGEVPVLEHGGKLLTQSGVILDYLAEKLDSFGWRDDDERREILRWILFDNHKLTSYTATLRFLRQFARTGETPVTAFFEARAKSAYGVLDRHLDGRRFVVGDRPTIADLSLCGYLFWPDEIGIDFSPYANIARWLDAIRSLPRWQAPYDLMPGHPLPKKA